MFINSKYSTKTAIWPLKQPLFTLETAMDSHQCTWCKAHVLLWNECALWVDVWYWPFEVGTILLAWFSFILTFQKLPRKLFYISNPLDFKPLQVWNHEIEVNSNYYLIKLIFGSYLIHDRTILSNPAPMSISESHKKYVSVIELIFGSYPIHDRTILSIPAPKSTGEPHKMYLSVPPMMVLHKENTGE